MGRLKSIADGLESFRRIITNFIWFGVILVILATLGWFAVNTSLWSNEETYRQDAEKVRVVPEGVDWTLVDGDVAQAMERAREAARAYGSKELDLWLATLMERVDNNFLDWYFNYWTQQLLGLKGMYQYGVHYVLAHQPSAAEAITQEIQEEFSRRVLMVEHAELVMNRIVTSTVDVYLHELTTSLDAIPRKYRMSAMAWERYLEDIASITSMEGGREVPLSLKTLTLASGGGSLLLAAKVKTAIAGAGTKAMAGSSGKLASTMAAKTGGKVVAKVGGKFFGVITGIGVLIWDLWDHSVTRRDGRPQLRSALEQYFSELKQLLLDEKEHGLMAPLNQLEMKVVDQLGQQRQ